VFPVVAGSFAFSWRAVLDEVVVAVMKDEVAELMRDGESLSNRRVMAVHSNDGVRAVAEDQRGESTRERSREYCDAEIASNSEDVDR